MYALAFPDAATTAESANPAAINFFMLLSSPCKVQIPPGRFVFDGGFRSDGETGFVFRVVTVMRSFAEAAFGLREVTV